VCLMRQIVGRVRVGKPIDDLVEVLVAVRQNP
jgi:hypothetical protein